MVPVEKLSEDLYKIIYELKLSVFHEHDSNGDIFYKDSVQNITPVSFDWFIEKFEERLKESNIELDFKKIQKGLRRDEI